MKTTTTPTSTFGKNPQSGFTLAEILIAMVIVMAIVGATLFTGSRMINQARVKAVVVAAGQISTACDAYVALNNPSVLPITEASDINAFAKNASLTTTAVLLSNATITDMVLQEAGLMKPMNLAIVSNPDPTGTVGVRWDLDNGVWTAAAAGAVSMNYNERPRIETYFALSTQAPGTLSATKQINFYLTSGSTIGITTGSRVTALVIPNITGSNAAAIVNEANNFKKASASAAWTDGRVVYAAPSAAGTTTLYYYIRHD